jgi:ABC-2 type transport system ATP-binding protein
MSAIAVHGLTRRFDDLVALEDVRFEVDAGEVVALLGPNGAGKTTALEILEGYLAPTAGSVSVLGEAPRGAGRRWRARIGVVLQSTSLDPQLSVQDSLGAFSRLFAEPRPIEEMLELTGLEANAQTRIGQLSGGQQRRVDLALGIIGRPEVLFLDEPTTGLDPEARRGCWTIVKQLAAMGTTVLLSTHYMEEAQQLASRLLVLENGRLVADRTPDQLRASTFQSVVRLPIPPQTEFGDLPDRLAGHLEPGQLKLLVPAGGLAGVLEQLLHWAQANELDLAGLEIAPPDLETTYLDLISQPHRTPTPSYA